MEKLTYSLVAAVVHSGSHDSGHYTAEILLKNDWYKFNDNKVRSTFPGPFGKFCSRSYVADQAVPQPSPYLLFYQLRTPVNSALESKPEETAVEDGVGNQESKAEDEENTVSICLVFTSIRM